MTEPPAASDKLVRGLGLLDSTMLVAGSMIGSGIFIVSADIGRLVGSAGWLLLVWAVTGALTLTAALSYGELAAMMPRAGGQYVYLREAYGPLWGFLYGWTLFLVIQTASIAAVAVAFASYLGYFVHLSSLKVKIVAVTAILVLSLINYLGVRWGAWTQNVFTLAKVGAMVVLLLLSFQSGAGKISNFAPLLPAAAPG